MTGPSSAVTLGPRVNVRLPRGAREAEEQKLKQRRCRSYGCIFKNRGLLLLLLLFYRFLSCIVMRCVCSVFLTVDHMSAKHLFCTAKTRNRSTTAKMR
ncbi:hypothetical protein SUGI_1018670 [Cryptomeria japonica]|nr:hypothetical protein SUGI_1018670 [Cryptomeria japonica]